MSKTRPPENMRNPNVGAPTGVDPTATTAPRVDVRGNPIVGRRGDVRRGDVPDNPSGDPMDDSTDVDPTDNLPIVPWEELSPQERFRREADEHAARADRARLEHAASELGTTVTRMQHGRPVALPPHATTNQPGAPTGYPIGTGSVVGPVGDPLSELHASNVRLTESQRRMRASGGVLEDDVENEAENERHIKASETAAESEKHIAESQRESDKAGHTT